MKKKHLIINAIMMISLLLMSCTVQINIGKKHKNNRKALHKKKDIHQRNRHCKELCSIYEYDVEFKSLIVDYTHPWCICMGECMDNNNYCENVYENK